ncbi:hypothetical protein ACUSIJ_22240 [Pseudochelatococcus sp. B33]
MTQVQGRLQLGPLEQLQVQDSEGLGSPRGNMGGNTIAQRDTPPNSPEEKWWPNLSASIVGSAALNFGRNVVNTIATLATVTVNGVGEVISNTIGSGFNLDSSLPMEFTDEEITQDLGTAKGLHDVFSVNARRSVNPTDDDMPLFGNKELESFLSGVEADAPLTDRDDLANELSPRPSQSVDMQSVPASERGHRIDYGTFNSDGLDDDSDSLGDKSVPLRERLKEYDLDAQQTQKHELLADDIGLEGFYSTDAIPALKEIRDDFETIFNEIGLDPGIRYNVFTALDGFISKIEDGTSQSDANVNLSSIVDAMTKQVRDRGIQVPDVSKFETREAFREALTTSLLSGLGGGDASLSAQQVNASGITDTHSGDQTPDTNVAATSPSVVTGESPSDKTKTDYNATFKNVREAIATYHRKNPAAADDPKTVALTLLAEFLRPPPDGVPIGKDEIIERTRNVVISSLQDSIANKELEKLKGRFDDETAHSILDRLLDAEGNAADIATSVNVISGYLAHVLGGQGGLKETALDTLWLDGDLDKDKTFTVEALNASLDTWLGVKDANKAEETANSAAAGGAGGSDLALPGWDEPAFELYRFYNEPPVEGWLAKIARVFSKLAKYFGKTSTGQNNLGKWENLRAGGTINPASITKWGRKDIQGFVEQIHKDAESRNISIEQHIQEKYVEYREYKTALVPEELAE